MAQHKMKQKVTLPKGIKRKSLKHSANAQKQKGTKKGSNVVAVPKKAEALKNAQVSAQITKIINERNEGILKMRADKDVGKNSGKK